MAAASLESIVTCINDSPKYRFGRGEAPRAGTTHSLSTQIGLHSCDLRYVASMLTSQKVIDAINDQIGYEFSAELQYYAIAAHFAAEALPQLSQHFFQQAEEEKGHALRFIKYVVDAGGHVVIPAIDAPKSKFKTPRDAVKLSLDQEIHVTNQINGLVELARKENDYITINFLQWFLTEQLEEVSSMDNLLKIIERAGTDLLQADEYLARVGVRAIPEPPKQ